MNRSPLGKVFSWIFIAFFLIAGIYVGVHLGRIIWSWFNEPGQLTVWRNLSTGEITRTANTPTNFLWDVVFGFFGFCAGYWVGAVVLGTFKHFGRK
jgi:hypothetical protein